jgi:PPOX class probable F420-dependent enzyme
MDAQRLATARTVRFLEREPIVWLSTVRPDGGPHVVPIWFWWDGRTITAYSKPDAQKARNIRVNPAAMLALGDADDDFDVGLIHARAELTGEPTPDPLPAPFVAKYGGRMAAMGLTARSFAATYSQVIRIVPDRYLGWHGRTTPRSARRVMAPTSPIVEPRRSADGEPVARRGRARRSGSFPGARLPPIAPQGAWARLVPA